MYCGKITKMIAAPMRPLSRASAGMVALIAMLALAGRAIASTCSYVVSPTQNSYEHMVIGGANVESVSNAYTVEVPDGWCFADVRIAKVSDKSCLVHCDVGTVSCMVNGESKSIGTTNRFTSTGTISLSAAASNPAISWTEMYIDYYYTLAGVQTPHYSYRYHYYETYYNQFTYVITAEYSLPKLSALSIVGDARIAADGNAAYICNATTEDGNTRAVSPAWSIIAGSEYATISSSGILSGRNATASDKSVTLQASYTFGDVTKTATKEVTVLGVPVLSEVSIVGPDSVNGDDATIPNAYHCRATYSDGTQYENVEATWTIISGEAYASISNNGNFTTYFALEDRYVTLQVQLSIGGITAKATKTVKICAMPLHDGGVYTPSEFGWQQPAYLTATTNSDDLVHLSVIKEWTQLHAKFCYRNYGTDADKITYALTIHDEEGNRLYARELFSNLAKGESRIFSATIPSDEKDSHFGPGTYKVTCAATAGSAKDRNGDNENYVFYFEVVDNLRYIGSPKIKGPGSLSNDELGAYSFPIVWDTDQMGETISAGIQIQLMNALRGNLTWSIASGAEYASLVEGKSFTSCSLDAHNTTSQDQTVVLQASFMWYSGETFEKDREVVLVKPVVIKANAYKVSYRKYDGSGETASEDLECGKTYTLAWLGSELGWSRPGYEFCGWVPWNPDTKPRLCKYDNGQPVKDLAMAGETIDLWAGWKSSSSYRVCFHRCAGPDDLTKMNQVILRNKEDSLAWMDSMIGWKRDGYTFAGWDESDKATSVKYANGAKVKNLAMNGGTKHLYAVWRAKDDHKYPYTVKYYKYDGSGETRTQSFKAGTVQSLAWLDSQLGWSRPGYEFVGWVPWNPDTKPRLCKYANGQKVVDLASKSGEVVSLYPAWKSSSSYRVCFNRNDGTGVKMNQVILRNKEDTLAWMDSQIGWKREGYVFKGWSETANGAVKYANGAKVKNLAMDGGTKHLYAIWRLAD